MTRPWQKALPVKPEELIIPEVSLYMILKKTAERFQDRAAIIFEGKKITYPQLLNRVNKLADSFNRLGMKKGERIGLMLSNHPDYIVSYYAAQALGLIVVQINPMYTPRELFQIVDNSKLNHMVVERDSLDIVNQVQFMYPFNSLILAGEKTEEVDHNSSYLLADLIKNGSLTIRPADISVREDIAVIQYTGGTSGKIKGAMLTHYNLVANVIQSRLMYGNDMKDGKEMVLTATPLYHVYAMTSAMNLGIYIGSTILLFKKFEIQEVLESIQTYQPTFFPGVPRMYNAFVNHPNVDQYGLDCLKFCSSGSAPLPVEIIKKFESLTGAIIGEGFGLSETSPSTHRNPFLGVRKVGSIGIPLPGTDCKVVDDDNNELPTKSVGELIIKGPQVMKGYWNNEVETLQALQNGWLYTGDLAMMDDDGYFYIVGRKKEMIINGGFNIYPQEVEGVLYEHPYIKEAVVVGLPDLDKGEVVKAYVVVKEGYQLDLEELKGHCYRNLTRYKVPKLFEIRDSLPRNTVGKLLKRKLIEEEKAKNERVD
ncbi:long-chain-fatty-acid-CoA ligase [Halalkalibacter wakoensis JCM 9140]|uniref:Long-chain-fatty-acid-CoA ligase n=1 Tax=Halalkalibacter wakoensis JCM 9140 TaxID=1236970 RepID=W4Q5E6_9BACI|nr:long-chain fatty acid--CoA ligase [Halalkalibacter wakoensis]GAE27175.1 long-chain-fatty-acid-CoA ligase [Halalkalibacter wakoensis JCM 9140]